jgi:predicted ATPase
VKINTLILENFRAYKSRIAIPFEDLTVFIGRNDVGKSTVLEALDIFFEGGTKKIESADASQGGDARAVRIGIVFDDPPDQLVLDSNAATTLENEHLLNQDGKLEIHKIYNCGIQTPKCAIHARAVHPNHDDAKDIVQKTQRELRQIVADRGLQNNCNQSENPSMRLAIYESIGDLQLQDRDVPLNDNNAKAIWAAIQNYLPTFALFQSDRPSSDQDPEVQNPMKVAIAQALDQLTTELDEITNQIQTKAQETAARTLAKLQETYPDVASTLKPNFKKPAWKNIFKLDLESDHGVPLNKRGSGVRRLVLLSFFQAEAERKRDEETVEGETKRPIIYGIEEPETAQHPDSQESIIKALRELAEAGEQVVLTTHVPALAGLIPLESLRYVERDSETQAISVRKGDEDVYHEIASTLGVLPDPVNDNKLMVAVLVEGKNDIDALKSLASVLSAAGAIADWHEDQIFWTIGGGEETLKDWIERGYLDKLGLPQVIIRDSDRAAEALPLDPRKATWLIETAKLDNVSPFITRKRNMDNYVHPGTIARLTDNNVLFEDEIDIDYVRIDREFANKLSQARQAADFEFNPTDHEGIPIAVQKPRAKRILNAYVMREMTVEEIAERASYTDEDGNQRHEVLEWMEAIRAHFRN